MNSSQPFLKLLEEWNWCQERDSRHNEIRQTLHQKLPDKNTSNPALYELYLTSNLWIAFLNNAASEQSARMNAMENASKNAREIVEKLNLLYNKARQARITIEFVEIISGASALWESYKDQMEWLFKWVTGE